MAEGGDEDLLDKWGRENKIQNTSTCTCTQTLYNALKYTRLMVLKYIYMYT